MNAMNAIAKRTYTLGWIFLLVGIIERVLIIKESFLMMAYTNHVLPHNFLQLSFLFFVITVASRACCPPEKA
jgi:hypothetical protein